MRHRRNRRLRHGLARAVVLAGLVGLTAWHVTRSSRLEAADSAFRGRQYAVALQTALEHLDRRGWSREGHRLAGLCLSRLDFSEQAEAHYQKAGPLSLEDLQTRAYAILRSNRREEAITAYAEILKRWPEDAESLRNLATVYMSQTRYREGLDIARRLAEHPDLDSQIVGWTMVGTMHHHLHEPDRAADAYDRVVELDPELDVMPLERWQFDLYFASDLFDAGRAREAAERLAVSPVLESHPMLLVLKGVAHQGMGELDEAERCWRRALVLDSSLVQAWSSLGKLELLRNHPDEAVGPLERALALSPDDYTAVYNLMMARRRLRQEDQVAELQKRLDRIKARSGSPTMSMGSATPMPEDAHE